MRIAINTRFLLSHKMEGFGWYTYEITSRIVEKHPEHQFFFFFDRPFDEKFVFANNVTPIILAPQARHPFLFYWWFEFSVKKALKKHKIDLFFSPDGYLSLSSNVKQVATIHDINFEHNPEDVGWLVRKYLTQFFPKFAKKADHILTVSDYSRNDIAKTYDINYSKITSIWNGASDIFKPIPEESKVIIRKKYTSNQEYFLFVGALSPRKNLKRLIEAFEIFKKSDSKNTQQLLIVGDELWKNSNANISISKSLKSQIHFTGHVELTELAQIMASAKIFTFVPYFEGFGIPLVEAMKCGTPILSGNLTSLPEIAGEAALYCDPYSVSDIAEKLSLLNNDDVMRREFSEKGLKRSEQFSWDMAAEKVWTVLSTV
tara:strand:- start:11049 stop:12167 length:1119 start_codon:yes stop_codon:yes gene_type:complete